MRTFDHRVLARWTVLVVATVAAVWTSEAAGLSFSTSPNVPNLPGVTLNGQAQTVNATMASFAVSDTLNLSGWNLTVNGDSGSAKSAIFKVYCPGPSACGSDAVGYVSGGFTLPANSLTLNTTGASWSGGLTNPTFQCNSGCNLDSAAPVKVASISSVAAITTWTASGFSATSIALSVPTTLRRPLQTGEVYRVDLVWTLGLGP